MSKATFLSSLSQISNQNQSKPHFSPGTQDYCFPNLVDLPRPTFLKIQIQLFIKKGGNGQQEQK